MENPPIEKLIAKLESIDVREWERKFQAPLVVEERFEEFVANINCLTFSIYLSRKPKPFTKSLLYACLSITNKERTIGIQYTDHKIDSVEAKEIGRLHKKIRDYYFSDECKEKQKQEFKEKLGALLSD